MPARCSRIPPCCWPVSFGALECSKRKAIAAEPWVPRSGITLSIEIPCRSIGLLRSANPGGIPTTGMRWWCLERTHRTRGTTGEGASPSLFCSHLGQPHLPKKPTPNPAIASRVGRYGADFAKMQLPTARRRPGVRHQEWPFKRGTGKTLLDSVSQAEMDGAERRNPDPPSGHWFGEQAPLVFCE